LPTELATAVDVAREFLVNAGLHFARLEEAKYDAEKEEWRILFDVGTVRPKIKTVYVETTTGKVIRVE